MYVGVLASRVPVVLANVEELSCSSVRSSDKEPAQWSRYHSLGHAREFAHCSSLGSPKFVRRVSLSLALAILRSLACNGGAYGPWRSSVLV
jgi:hypothetical protein